MNNYFKTGNWFRCKYIYMDTEDYLADSLFYKREIPMRFKGTLSRKDDEYCIVYCSFPKKYETSFLEAMEELKNKMMLLGHLDYESYCEEVIGILEEGQNTDINTDDKKD